jgi:hypothetical protein
VGDEKGQADDFESTSEEAVFLAASADHAREMYRRFLESDYPDALAMAEQVLRERPDDVMALAIRTECQAAICKPETVPAPKPTDAPRASASAVRLDSEMPTGIEIVLPPASDAALNDEPTPVYVTVTRGEPSREMCRRFLESDHPAALLLAESLLEANPEDRMARAIAEQCRAALERRSSQSPSEPPSDDDTQVSLSPPGTPPVTPEA